MFRIIVLGVTIWSFSFSALAQNIVFQDSVFKKMILSKGIDLNEDKEISLIEASTVDTLILNGIFWDRFGYQNLSNLDEIHYFNNINYLSCINCRLTKLDLTENKKLKYLNVARNQYLDTLIIGRNDYIEEINLDEVYTANEFDFSGLINLKILSYGRVLALNVSRNLNLETLLCDFSRGNIDVSNNPKLKKLICKNQTQLNLTNNPLLEHLECEGGDSLKLDSIDLSQNPNLKELILFFNNLTKLDLSKNINLEHIDCSFNHIDSLDFTHNLLSKRISCVNDSLKYIKLDGLVYLEVLATGNFLNSSSNNLSKLDVSSNFNLIQLSCSSGNINSLDLTKNIHLETLRCGGNEIDSLYLCKNIKIKYIDISEMPSLKKLFVPTAFISKGEIYGVESVNYQLFNCSVIDDVPFLQADELKIVLYPNPTNNIVYIKTQGNVLTLSHYEIYGFTTGRLIQSGWLKADSIETSGLSKGIYLLIIYPNTGSPFFQKIIKE